MSESGWEGSSAADRARLLILAILLSAAHVAAEPPNLERATQLLAQSDVAASAPATFRAHLAISAKPDSPAREIGALERR